MNAPHQNAEKLAEIQALLLEEAPTHLAIFNINSRLATLFGSFGGAVLKPQFMLTMPFGEKYDAVHRIVPVVSHKSYIRPETNQKANNSIPVPSPFSPSNRRMPLVGVSLIADISHPGDTAETFAYFEVKPLPDAQTVITVAAQRKDWQRGNELLIGLSEL